MPKERLTAFSDGVIAIIITIMVLDLRAPSSSDPAALRSLLPALASYILSFIYVGIYWNNHHHIFQAVDRISGMTLWANLHLLFWLSLVPFVTRWVGESGFAKWPVIAYGVVLIMSALAWDIERRGLIRVHDPGSDFAQALAGGLKEVVSLVLYAAGIAAALFNPWIACAFYALVAAIWIVPDRRVEREICRKRGG